MKKIIILKLFIVCINFYSSLGEEYVGNDCIVEHSQQSGTCKNFRECTAAKNDLRFKLQRPTICGWINNDQIVCCANPTAAVETRMPDSKRLKQCKKYEAATTETIRAGPLYAGGTSVTVTNKKCGHQKQPLIVGGSPAAGKEFPHSALLGNINSDGSRNWFCGGSLISPRYVLTAAHCLLNGNITQVRLGELNLLTEEDDAKPIDLNVETIVVHPDYKTRTNYHDIALIRLEKDVEINEYIKPICLPDGNEKNLKAIATGWGDIIYLGARSNTLQKVTLEMYPHAECLEKFDTTLDQRKLPQGIIESTQLCAGHRTLSRDTCQGDSGGPIQIYHPTVDCSYTQVGITSFGKGCGNVNIPGIYTRLSYYVDWIENIIWPDDNAP